MGKVLRWAALFVVLVILVSGGIAFYTVFFGEKPLTMPSFKEMSAIDAVAEAEKLGLAVRVEQIESTLPPGRVLAQFPDAGAKIRTDKNIILKISRGGETKPIPDVRGVEFNRATRMLQEQGFSVGDVIRIKDGNKTIGEVIAQSPAAPASVPVSKKIDILVSAGPDDGRFIVPDVAQMGEPAARTLLTSVGLKVDPSERVRHRNILQGLVVNTRPAAGTLVRAGSQIKIFVSAGDVEVAQTQTTPGAVTVPGRGTTTTRPGTEPNVSELSVLDQQSEIRRQQEIGRTSPQPEVSPANPAPVPPSVPAEPAATGNKIARVRYQVPPIIQPLNIKVEIADPNGTRVLLNRSARGNETIQIDGSYAREAIVTITLGGEFVWREQFK